MGKILKYLGIEEAGQTRDILDAERLLEGMQSLYANSPEGKKKDAFAVPLAEMTKTFIEKVKGIKPKEPPKEQPQEQEVESSDVATELAEWFIDFQKLFLEYEKVTIRIVLENETIQKEYILWMQRAVLNLFQSSKEKQKRLKDFLVTLNDNEENRYKFLHNLISKYDEANDYMLLYNFLGLYNVLGQEAKENMVEAYKIIGNNYLNPALFENEMEATEATPQEAGSATNLPSFIKPISEKGTKPSKPNKPSKPKPSKVKFEVGDSYLVLQDSGDTTLTIVDVDIDHVKVKYANGIILDVEINKAEGKVNKGQWQKIDNDNNSLQDFKIGDKVRIKEESLYYGIGPENPTNQVGEISQIDNNNVDFPILVSWPNGNFNGYDRKDLEKVSNDQTQTQTQEIEFKVGDNFITSDNQDLIFTIDFIQPDSIGVVYFDGLTAIINAEDFKKGLKSGYYKPYIEPQQETDLYFKVGDRFIDKNNKNIYSIESVDKKNGIVKVYVLNKNGEVESTENDGILAIIQEKIKEGTWIKTSNETKPTKPRKPRTPTTLTEKDKQIKHILDINIDDIDF